MPATAVVTRDQKPFIFVVAQKGGDASVKLTPVKLGLTVDNQTEITEGLTVGDEIVVKGMALLNDGAKINIMN